jgi:hypothetical protein
MPWPKRKIKTTKTKKTNKRKKLLAQILTALIKVREPPRSQAHRWRRSSEQQNGSFFKKGGKERKKTCQTRKAQ